MAAATGALVFVGSAVAVNAEEWTGAAEPPRGVSVERADPAPPAPESSDDTDDTDEPAVRAAEPVRVRVPAIGVDASVDPLGVDENNALEVPEVADDTGWWSGGWRPGENGPGVIVGHVDSYLGPGVFMRLAELDAGDEIIVDRADGTSVTFAVNHLERHAKDDFPTESVYGDTSDPQLRLVTCGGDFDADERSYDDNVIAYATVVDSPAADSPATDSPATD